jgi:hypothetical protein
MKDPMVPPGVTQASSPGVPARVAAGPAQSPGGRAKLQARAVVVTDVTKRRPNGLPPSRPGPGELRGVRSRLSDQVVCPGRRAGAVARQGGAGRRRPWRPRTCPAQYRGGDTTSNHRARGDTRPVTVFQGVDLTDAWTSGDGFTCSTAAIQQSNVHGADRVGKSSAHGSKRLYGAERSGYRAAGR